MPEEPANVNVTSALPDDVRESVAAANFKTLGDGPAFYANLAMGNAVQAQQQLSNLGLTVTAKAVDMVSEKQVEEMGGIVAALQQIMKGAQTTPPVTP